MTESRRSFLGTSTGDARRVGRMPMAKCKSCEAEVVWIRTKRGKSMICDPELSDWPDGTVVTVGGQTLTNGGRGYRTHWASCPSAGRHRKSAQKDMFDD